MKPTKLIWLIAALTGGLLCPAFAAAGPWDQPASALAAKISEILGPGQARLVVENLSSIPADQIPAIRKLLSQELKAHGITSAGAESANTVRVTLSESASERLWVAEIVQGTDSRVTMVDLGPVAADPVQRASSLVLRRQLILTAREPVLGVLETDSQLIALEPEQIVFYTQSPDGWHEQQRTPIEVEAPLARDPRGVLEPGSSGFDAWIAGAHCTGNSEASTWKVDCRASDDSWTVEVAPVMRAFYNVSRGYFTGLVIPDPGPALPPFYSIAVLPGESGPAVLIGGIDGKVQSVEGGSLRRVAGTRDWGSDFAVLQSGCGTGTQVVVSGSGDTASDSLRAYEVHRAEAQAASEALDMQGSVTALMTAPDQKSVTAVIHNAQNEYEVDRVTALCN